MKLVCPSVWAPAPVQEQGLWEGTSAGASGVAGGLPPGPPTRRLEGSEFRVRGEAGWVGVLWRHHTDLMAPHPQPGPHYSRVPNANPNKQDRGTLCTCRFESEVFGLFIYFDFIEK